jgi:hypothetical protein
MKVGQNTERLDALLYPLARSGIYLLIINFLDAIFLTEPGEDECAPYSDHSGHIFKIPLPSVATVASESLFHPWTIVSCFDRLRRASPPVLFIIPSPSDPGRLRIAVWLGCSSPLRSMQVDLTTILGWTGAFVGCVSLCLGRPGTVPVPVTFGFSRSIHRQHELLGRQALLRRI